MQRIIDLFASHKYLAWGVAILLVILVALSWLWIAETPQTVAQDDIPGSDAVASVSMFIDITVKLGVVLLIIFISLNLMRWLQNRSVGQVVRELSIRESIRLSQRQAIHIISVGSKEILVGATDQSITYLADLDQTSELGAQPEDQLAPKEFDKLLGSVLKANPPDEANNV